MLLDCTFFQQEQLVAISSALTAAAVAASALAVAFVAKLTKEWLDWRK